MRPGVRFSGKPSEAGSSALEDRHEETVAKHRAVDRRLKGISREVTGPKSRCQCDLYGDVAVGLAESPSPGPLYLSISYGNRTAIGFN